MNAFGFERLTDLMVLCEQCRALEHGKAMRAGMPIAGPSVTEMTVEARQRDELRRRARGEGRDIQKQRFLMKKRDERGRTRAEKRGPGHAFVPPIARREVYYPPVVTVSHECGYLCDCAANQAAITDAKKRGVRPIAPLPLKRAA